MHRFTSFMSVLMGLLPLAVSGISFKGTVYNEKHETIPFAIVKIVNGDEKVMCTDQGIFTFDLAPGKYVLQISAMSYDTLTTEIRVSGKKAITKDFVLQDSSNELNSIEIFANSRDIAREVISNAMEKRSGYYANYARTRFDMYQKISLQREFPDTNSTDSLIKDLKRKERPRIMDQEELRESYSAVIGNRPRFHEKILAYKNYNDLREWDGLSGGIRIDVGEHDITPQQNMWSNPYIITSNYAFTEFDILTTNLDLPSLCNKKILSPLGVGAMLNYRYTVEAISYRDNKKVYLIKVDPIFNVEPLFSGIITIEDGTWAVLDYDLSLNPLSLFYFSSFRIRQINHWQGTGDFYPEKRTIEYTIQEGALNTYTGRIAVDYSNVEIDSLVEKEVFTDEVQTYDDLAFDRDSLYWVEKRTLEIDSLEAKFIHRTDSLRAYYVSQEYYEIEDSTINNLNIWDYLLNGITHKNRARQWQFYLNPLIMQMNIFGIGGYRHRLGGTFQKEFENNYLMEVEGDVDYGIRNKDIRGKAGIGLTYIPKKFVRTFIRVGDYYDMINTYASVGSMFSRSNYVRSQTFSIAQRMELVNGLFGEITFDYSDQKPINNLLQDNWSSDLFGDVNKPIDFERYIKMEVKLDIKYYFKQKYIIKKGKKIILGSKYPVFSMIYRKGLPRIFNSEVDFDYVEIGFKHSTELGRWGTVDWSVLGGTFFNRNNLRLLEYKYFRGSDAFFFSDPLRSFQLLGPTLSTPNAFYRANYFQHFDGIILNKIPLINRLKLTEAGGAGFIAIPNQDFAHAEFYLGLERVVRIRKQLFRFGVYGCTSDSSLDKANYELKFGVNFFNTYTKKWSF